jgi:hypothetical protein
MKSLVFVNPGKEEKQWTRAPLTTEVGALFVLAEDYFRRDTLLAPLESRSATNSAGNFAAWLKNGRLRIQFTRCNTQLG